MKEILGRVEKGVVKLPDSVSLPEGSRVRVLWDEDSVESLEPLERQALDEQEVKLEIEWATGKRFEGG
jgi:predicted DNA-binding antitoxin AbrB/MazE fold protein